MSDLGEFCVDLGVEDEKYPKREEGVEDKMEPHHIHLGGDTEWKKRGDTVQQPLLEMVRKT